DRHHPRRCRQPDGRPRRRAAAGGRRDAGRELHRSGAHPRRHLPDLLADADRAPDRPVREGRMNRLPAILLIVMVLAALAAVPAFAGPYPLGLMIGILGYGVLATAWSLF